MEQPNQFRSAFNGFNREDVVRYLEYINNKHSAQLAQLNNELDQLRRKQNAANPASTAELEAQLAALREENAALQLRIGELEAERREREDSTARTVVLPNAAELEAYRRAERVERLAKERANQIGIRATVALTEASTRVDSATGQISRITELILEQLDQLKAAVADSRQAFQDAAEAVATLHSDEEE